MTPPRHPAGAAAARARFGRLAPSPTGRLHLGNLSSLALAWIQARAARAEVILRIEDLDPPRCVEGAEARIIDDMKWLGIDWDEGPDRRGPNHPYHQSARSASYEAALEALIDADLVYPCFCSRRDVRDVLSAPHTAFDEGTEYPGTCSDLPRAAAAARGTTEPHAMRFRARGTIEVVDGIRGPVVHDLAKRPGDFVLRRRDGLWAYQFAVVVDDAAMAVTDVVRGADLLDSTPRQMALFDAIGAPRPATWHVPMLHDERGERLSKRAASTARDGLVDAGWTPESLVGALTVLWGWQDEPRPLSLAEAVSSWDPSTLTADTIRVPDALFESPASYRLSVRDKPAAGSAGESAPDTST